jgi:hypothetical protein
VASKIQIRRDTVANWNAVSGSVILAAGEIGYETDTRNLKIGDGTNVWSALKYQAPVYSGTNSTLAAATLAVDQTNNRVGIGTASPQVKLHTAVLGPTNGIVEIVQNTAGVTGSQIQITQSTIQDWAIGQPAATDAFAFWRGRNTSVGGDELMRISSTGNVGIGTSAPLDQLHIQGATPIIRLKDTTSTTAEYVQISASNSTGSVLIAADPANTTASTTADISVDGTTRISATTTGVALTGAVTATGLSAGASGLTSSGGITLSNGALTLNAGTTISVPAGSVAGAAIADNGVTVAKLAQVAVPSFLGTPSGTASATNVSALTQAQSRTMLGLVPSAFTALGTANTIWTKLDVSGGTAINLDLDVTTLTVGVITRFPISHARLDGTGSASVTCRAIVEAGETFVVFGGYDLGSVPPFTAAGTTGLSWYWRNEVWAATAGIPADSQHCRFVPTYAFNGANTVNVLRWGGGSGGTGVVQTNCEVIAIRLS